MHNDINITIRISVRGILYLAAIAGSAMGIMFCQAFLLGQSIKFMSLMFLSRRYAVLGFVLLLAAMLLGFISKGGNSEVASVAYTILNLGLMLDCFLMMDAARKRRHTSKQGVAS